MAGPVPLSRFAPRVGGGSDFDVRRTEHHLIMDTLKEVGIAFVGMLGLAWAAVFVVVFIDKLRGRSVPRFLGCGRYHVPKPRPLAWWQHLLLSPVYCLFILLMSLLWLFFFPPMFIIELPARLKARRIES
jgi:hypothetical protein